MIFFKRIIIVFLLMFVCLNSLWLTSSVVYGALNIDTFGETTDTYSRFKPLLTSDNSLAQNISCLFSPSKMQTCNTGQHGGMIRQAIRTIAIAIVIWFVVWTGWNMMMHADNESEIKKDKMSLVYILAGSILLFGLMWVLEFGLGMKGSPGGGDATTITNLTDSLQEEFLLQILAFLRAAAFFAAIVFMARAGIKVVSAFEKEDKIKEGRRGVVNVILALFFIKIVDYVYYIAASKEFKNEAVELLARIGKVMGYILGALLLITVFYGGLQLIFSRGNEESWKKGMMILKSVFLVVMIVSLFLLITFQVINQFG